MALRMIETQTKAEAAYVAIRDAIRNGDVSPGERLVLRDVAKELGMSFTPVREALQVLAAQGLVVQQTHGGTIVASLTAERAEEVYRLRLLLEPHAAFVAAERATPSDVESARAALHRLAEAIADERVSEIPALNAEFHRVLYSASQSPYLIEFIDKLWNGLPFQAISLASRTEKSHSEHEAILRAFEQGDPSLCSHLMEGHIAAGAAAFLGH